MVPHLRQRQSQRPGADVEDALLRLAGAIGPGQVAAMEPQGVSSMLWALPQLALRPEELTGLLAEAAGLQAPYMSAQHISASALGLARLGVQDGRVFAALFVAAQRNEQFISQQLCSLCWAAAVAHQGQLAGHVRRCPATWRTPPGRVLSQNGSWGSCTRCTCGCWTGRRRPGACRARCRRTTWLSARQPGGSNMGRACSSPGRSSSTPSFSARSACPA